MNLPKVHERRDVVNKADFEFTLKSSDILKEYGKDSKINDYINALAVMVINLTAEERQTTSIMQAKLEEAFLTVSEEFGLTYGEQVKLLADRIMSEANFVIRWERNNNKE